MAVTSHSRCAKGKHPLFLTGLRGRSEPTGPPTRLPQLLGKPQWRLVSLGNQSRARGAGQAHLPSHGELNRAAPHWAEVCPRLPAASPAPALPRLRGTFRFGIPARSLRPHLPNPALGPCCPPTPSPPQPPGSTRRAGCAAPGSARRAAPTRQLRRRGSGSGSGSSRVPRPPRARLVLLRAPPHRVARPRPGTARAGAAAPALGMPGLHGAAGSRAGAEFSGPGGGGGATAEEGRGYVRTQPEMPAVRQAGSGRLLCTHCFPGRCSSTAARLPPSRSSIY